MEGFKKEWLAGWGLQGAKNHPKKYLLQKKYK